MKNLKGACLFAQSGGPTAVINSSAAGVFTQALLQSDRITAVYGAANGIAGVLNEKFYDMSKEDPREIELLKWTPSSALGSVRYKLKDSSDDDRDYKRILEVFKKYNIRFFFYNGGNDSMDTCNKISKYIGNSGWECNVIGVPKTIDNDLYGTDHCPGYGSAAKYIANTVMEINLDVHVYDIPSVCVIETMGRNAGWLAASSVLAAENGLGPDLVYLPESPFSVEKFIADVKAVCAKKRGQCLIVVSEGIRDEHGRLINDVYAKSSSDCFGHTQLGGISHILASEIKKATGFKTRGIELCLMQRCAAHVASLTDVEETFEAGRRAVLAALDGETDKMVVYSRKANVDKYECVFDYVPLELAANAEKTVPQNWIINDGTYLSQEFIDYALPLIQGDGKAPLENGLPRFARLKKELVKL